MLIPWWAEQLHLSIYRNWRTSVGTMTRQYDTLILCGLTLLGLTTSLKLTLSCHQTCHCGRHMILGSPCRRRWSYFQRSNGLLFISIMSSLTNLNMHRHIPNPCKLDLLAIIGPFSFDQSDCDCSCLEEINVISVNFIQSIFVPSNLGQQGDSHPFQ